MDHLKRCKTSNLLDEFATVVFIIDVGSIFVFPLIFQIAAGGSSTTLTDDPTKRVKVRADITADHRDVPAKFQ